MTPRLIEGLTFGPGRLHCERGHERHETELYVVDVHGDTGVACYPYFPERLSFPLETFAYDLYATDGPYCPGRDPFGQGLQCDGLWDAYETRMLQALLGDAKPGEVALDFGAHVGWYTCICARAGLSVVAFEAEHETAELCRLNGGRVGEASVIETWIDEHTPRLRSDAEDVLFLKADVEGAERHVFECCRDLFAAGKVRYALLEISPCFRPDYGDLMRDLAGMGYAAYRIPDKTCRTPRDFGVHPLARMRDGRIRDVDAYLAGVHQANVLFTREWLP